MDGEAGWWTTSGNIGLPPLARVMGVGRQQQQQWSGVNSARGMSGADGVNGVMGFSRGGKIDGERGIVPQEGLITLEIPVP